MIHSKRARFHTLFGWVIATCASLATVTTASQAETLADALVGAYNTSGLIAQNRATLRAADESVAQAVGSLLPVLSWQSEMVRDFGERTTTDILGRATTQGLEATTHTLALSANWQLYDFGADRARVDAAKATVLATRAGLVSIEQRVLLRAVSAFMNVRAAEETVAIRRNNIRLLEEEQRAARERFDVGEVTRTDVALAQAALAAARSALSSAQGQLDSFREEYRNVVGRIPGQLRPPPALPALEPDVERAAQIAVGRHPDIKQAQNQIAASEYLVAAAQSDMKPNISLSGNLSHSDRTNSVIEGTGGSLTLRSTVPIYRGGQLSSAVRQARAQRDAARSNLLTISRNVHANVGNAYADLRAARAQISAASDQIRAAQIAFDGVREEAKLGARTTLDVLNAEQQLLNARASRVQAEAAQYIAAYGVIAAQGYLTAQDLELPVQIYDPEAYYNLAKGAPARLSPQGIKLERVLRALDK